MPDGDVKWRLTEIKRELSINVSPALEGTQEIQVNAMKALRVVMERHLPAVEQYINMPEAQGRGNGDCVALE